MTHQPRVDLAHDLDVVVERLSHEFEGIEVSVIDHVVHEPPEPRPT